MNAILIEDDQNKAEKILNYLKSKFKEINLIHRMSYQSGLRDIFKNNFDFVLLDMSLPTYDQGKSNFSGKPRNFGGRDILKEMKRYKKTSKVLIITQYNEFDGGSISLKELDKQLMELYPNLYYGYVYYSSKQSEWENKLLEYVTRFEND